MDNEPGAVPTNRKYAINRAVLEAGSHVFPHMVDGELVYVKKRRPAKNPAGRLMQRALYAITRNTLLVPTGASASNVATEVATLLRLERLGVRAPRVLHAEDDYFVMTSVGKRLDYFLREHRDDQAKYIAMAGRALRGLHDLGLAHGGAQVRNIAVSGGEIWFLDFEENIPGDRVGPFQLRDMFLFLFSLERSKFDPDLPAVCAAYDGDDSGTTMAAIAKLLARIRVVGIMDSRLFSFIRMRDVRCLTSLVKKSAGAFSTTP